MNQLASIQGLLDYAALPSNQPAVRKRWADLGLLQGLHEPHLSQAANYLEATVLMVMLFGDAPEEMVHYETSIFVFVRRVFTVLTPTTTWGILQEFRRQVLDLARAGAQYVFPEREYAEQILAQYAQ